MIWVVVVAWVVVVEGVGVGAGVDFATVVCNGEGGGNPKQFWF